MSVLFALLSAVANAGTSVLQRLANVRAPRGLRIARLIRYLVSQPLWLLGSALMVATFVFNAVALYFGSLTLVQPLLVTELVFTLALRKWWLHDDVARRSWTAAAVTSGGLAGFLSIASPSEGTRVPSAAAWALAIITRAAIVGALLLAARRGSPGSRAALTGCAAGLVWSVDAAFVKSATAVLRSQGWLGLVESWPLYALLGTGILGTLLLQASLHVGPLAASQPAVLVTDPLASIVIGIELFGERLASGPAAVVAQVLLLVMMGVGVVLLSRWAPPPVADVEERRPLRSAELL